MRNGTMQDTWPRCWMFSAAAGVGGAQLWPLGQQAGSGVFAVFSAILWLIAARNLNAGLRAWDIAAAHRGVRRRTEKVSKAARKKHGRARFSKWKDLKGSKLNSKKGIALGSLNSKPLRYAGDASVLAVAGPGAGKTTSLAQPFLLESRNFAVVVDVKGTLFATTHKARERMGHRIWCLSPCWEELDAQFGGTVPLRDDGFDPGAFIDPESPSVLDQVNMLAELLMPAGKNATDNDEYWRTFSIEILVAFMLLQLEVDGRVSLVGLRGLLLSDDEELPKLIEGMAESTAFSGVLAENGKRLSQVLMNSPKLWSSGLSGACKALRQYDAHGHLGKHVSKSGVDFRKFRDEPTTCYIQLPTDKMSGAYAAWLGTVLCLAMEHIARDGKKGQVTFLLDEFQNLPPLLPVLKGLALYREAQIQFLFLIQFLAALASQRLYGESWREFLGCEVVMAFGPSTDMQTLRLFSELAGHESFRSPGFSTHPDQALHDELGLSLSLGNQGAPLIRPEEIRTLPKGKAIIFAENHNPIVADKRSYLKVRSLRRKAGRNPFFRK